MLKAKECVSKFSGNMTFQLQCFKYLWNRLFLAKQHLPTVAVTLKIWWDLNNWAAVPELRVCTFQCLSKIAELPQKIYMYLLIYVLWDTTLQNIVRTDLVQHNNKCVCDDRPHILIFPFYSTRVLHGTVFLSQSHIFQFTGSWLVKMSNDVLKLAKRNLCRRLLQWSQDFKLESCGSLTFINLPMAPNYFPVIVME